MDLDLESLRRMIPQARDVLEDPHLTATATAIGERPVVLHVPRRATERTLPPTYWEESRLSCDKVPVILHFHRRQYDHRQPTGTSCAICAAPTNMSPGW